MNDSSLIVEKMCDQFGVTVVTVSSPFHNSILSFDNKEAYADLVLTIPGVGKPLYLHRMYLASGSSTFERIFKGESNPYATYDPATQTMNWVDGRATSDPVYLSVLVKWLRFCYGESQPFSAVECPVALTVLSELQLKGDIRTTMENQMIETARTNGWAAADMLSVYLRDKRKKEEADKMLQSVAAELLETLVDNVTPCTPLDSSGMFMNMPEQVFMNMPEEVPAMSEEESLSHHL